MTDSLLSLDPGKDKVYGALNAGTDRLVAIVNFDPDQPEQIALVDRIVLERMVITHTTPNPQNILQCERAGNRVAGRHRCPVVDYTAAQWKGNLKKPQHHLHVWRALEDRERALFPADTYEIISAACATLAKTGKVKNYSFETHNYLDAAGLLLFEMKRIGRGGARIK